VATSPFPQNGVATMDFILVVIHGYWWILMDIILVVIGGYFIGGNWWLL
jgi:hypothetical protein